MKIGTDCRICYDPDIMPITEACKDMIEIMKKWSRKLNLNNNRGYRLLGQPSVILNGMVIPVTKSMNYYDIIRIYEQKIKFEKYKNSKGM